MTDAEILETNQEGRKKCVVYTRVMGYHRPVESFNIGKKGEHYERSQFVEPKRYNSDDALVADERRVVGM